MTDPIAWCRMNDCYRTSQPDSDFCTRHGWNQPPKPKKSGREPKARTPNRRTASSHTVAAGYATSRPAQPRHPKKPLQRPANGRPPGTATMTAEALTVEPVSVGLDPLRDIRHREARAARELADWLAGQAHTHPLVQAVLAAKWTPKASVGQCVLSHVSDRGSR